METRDNINVSELYFTEAQSVFLSVLKSNPQSFTHKRFLEYFEYSVNEILESYNKKNKKYSIKDVKKEKRIKVKKSLLSSLRKLSIAMFEAGDIPVYFSEKDIFNSSLFLINNKLKNNLKESNNNALKQSNNHSILLKNKTKVATSLPKDLPIHLSKEEKNMCFEMYEKSFNEHIKNIRDKKENRMSKLQMEKLAEERSRMRASVAWLGSSYYTPDYLQEVNEAINAIEKDVDAGKYPSILKVYCEEERNKYHSK